MKEKVAPFLAFMAAFALAMPAFADDPKSAFMGFIRAHYNPKSIRDITRFYPEEMAKRMNENADPAAMKQSYAAYRAKYLYNIKFEFDQAADESTEQVAGKGTNLSGLPVNFSATMVKEKDGWKVKEWKFEQDPYEVHEYLRTHPELRGHSH